MQQGHNVKRLIFHKMSLILAPDGGDIDSTLTAIKTPGAIAKARKKAEKWVADSFVEVRQSRGGQGAAFANDEILAGVILKQVKERLAAQRQKR